MDGWLQELWLVAIHETVPDGDIRRWWNGKDTVVLDDIIDAAPGVRLGVIIEVGPEMEPSGPVRRIHDLLFLRGTCPEHFHPNPSSSYVLPVMDAELRAALLAAFASRPDDHPLMEASPAANLVAFLDEHPGALAATRCTEGVLVHISDPGSTPV